jgi:hypothetical protein
LNAARQQQEFFEGFIAGVPFLGLDEQPACDDRFLLLDGVGGIIRLYGVADLRRKRGVILIRVGFRGFHHVTAWLDASGSDVSSRHRLTRCIGQWCEEGVQIDKADAEAAIQLLGWQSAVMDQS